MACALDRLDSLRLLSLGIHKGYYIARLSINIKELKAKVREAIRVINEYTFKRVFKNMETRLNFVVGEEGGQSKHNMT